MSANIIPPATRLAGRWLAAGRIVWIVFALILTGLQVASQVAAFRESRNVSLTPAQVQALHAMGLSVEFYAAWVFSWQIPLPLVWGGLGLLIFWRKSNDRTGLIVSAMMVGIGMAASIPPWKAFVAAYPDWSWLVPLAAFIGNVCINSFIFVFPTGRYVPRWTVGLALILSASNILISYDFVLPAPLVTWVNGLDWFFPVFIIVSLASAVLAPIYRYQWVSTPIEREQTKWVVFTIAVAFAIFATAASTVFLFPGNNPIQGDITFITVFVQPLGWIGVFQLIALAIAVSILRYRLFDIDLLIRRTLQYSVISGLLALTYFGLIVILQRIFAAVTGQTQSPLVTVASTLTIAALFLPLRRWVQDVIDLRFFRRKYDAQKVLAEFAATCRDETNLEELTARLVDVAQETMQPENVTLWLKNTSPPNPLSLWERGKAAGGIGGEVDS
jgi:hypothetical protein